jgi:hypothetical protein
LSCVLAAAAGVLAAAPDAATGCATVWPGEPGAQNAVAVANETALIVWDEKGKTEHFVRRAQFRGTAADFGLLVPTPNRPELAVATDAPFRELDRLTAARVGSRLVIREVEREWDFDLSCGADKPVRFTKETAEAAAGPTAGAAGGVEVLDQKTVGDYDAAVLTFRKGDFDAPGDGALELARWLAKHGYQSPPGVEKWLRRYVDDQWYVTAFRIAAAAAPPAGRRDVQPRPVRMSFKADRPVYPYSEPEPEPAAPAARDPRLLRVFVAARGRFDGKLGDGTKEWPAPTVWAGPADATLWAGVFPKAKAAEAAPGDEGPAVRPPQADGVWWLTEFEDRSTARPSADDLYFEPAATQAAVERPPQTVTTVRFVEFTPWWHYVTYCGALGALFLGARLTVRVLGRLTRSASRTREPVAPAPPEPPPAEPSGEPAEGEQTG